MENNYKINTNEISFIICLDNSKNNPWDISFSSICFKRNNEEIKIPNKVFFEKMKELFSEYINES